MNFRAVALALGNVGVDVIQFVPSLINTLPAVPGVSEIVAVLAIQFVPSDRICFNAVALALGNVGVDATMFVPSLIITFPLAGAVPLGHVIVDATQFVPS